MTRCADTDHNFQPMLVERKKQSGDWFINRPKLDVEKFIIVCTKCGAERPS